MLKIIPKYDTGNKYQKNILWDCESFKTWPKMFDIALQ